jgi:outer membrane protein assembly factor BamB
MLFTHCSFDNKTGIWLNERKPEISKTIENKSLEDAFKKEKLILKEKKITGKNKIQLGKKLKNNSWLQSNFNNFNNYENINFKNENIKILRTARLAKLPMLSQNSVKIKAPLYYKDTMVYSDSKGNINIYSLGVKKRVFTFNFYKKKFKKIKKNINLLIKDNVIFASDNLGYLYALDVNKSKIIWAQNFGIPFRSEIKFINGQIILANQDNTIYSINHKNGDKNWTYGTSNQFLKSNFKNSIVMNNEGNILFLNTNGELYNIDVNIGIKWMLNFKPTSSDEEAQLFLSVPLIINKDNLILANNNMVQNLNPFTGLKKWSKQLSVDIKGSISGKHLFLLSKKLLICIELETGKIVWSRDFLNVNKDNINYKKLMNIGDIRNLSIANDEILLFSSNGYLLSFNHNNGDLKTVNKISKGLGSKPIFVEGNLYFFDESYRLVKYN